MGGGEFGFDGASRVETESRSGKTNSRSKHNSRLASKNFIKKGRNELACIEHIK